MKQKNTKVITLRIPESLKLNLEMLALKEGERTLNKFLIKVLEEYVKEQKG